MSSSSFSRLAAAALAVAIALPASAATLSAQVLHSPISVALSAVVVTATPEPATIALMAGGLAVLGIAARRRRNKR